MRQPAKLLINQGQQSVESRAITGAAILEEARELSGRSFHDSALVEARDQTA